MLDEIYKLSNIDGKYKMISKKELLFIYDYIRNMPKNGNIIQLGVFLGATAAIALKAMSDFNVNGKLFLCDVYKYHNAGAPKIKPFRERRDVNWSSSFLNTTKSNLKPYIKDRTVIFIEGYTDDVNLDDIKQADLIFIDADHTTHGCLLDLLKFSQILNTNGVILIHDYTAFKEVKQAVHIFLSIRPDFKIIDACDSIIKIKKVV